MTNSSRLPPDRRIAESNHAATRLVAIGASLAVNCTTNLDKHLTAAQALGVPQEQIDEVAALMVMIRSKAVHHIEKAFGGIAAPSATAGCASAASAGCC